MSLLNLEGRRYLIFGVANRKSVAWVIAQALEKEGAEVIFSVRSEARKESLAKLLGERTCYVCDVEFPEQISRLAGEIGEKHGPFDGIVHSIAFANFEAGFRPFHETRRQDFLQSMAVSSFSLVEIANAFKPYMKADASVVSISISAQVTAENYGYLSPIKAALDSSTRFLAKSFSADTRIRFNTVNAGPLKTSASAGIPGYLENYLFAEKLTFRKEAIATQEVANTAVFLLSPASSGINGQGIVVDQGISLNYFDKEVVKAATKPN